MCFVLFESLKQVELSNRCSFKTSIPLHWHIKAYARALFCRSAIPSCRRLHRLEVWLALSAICTGAKIYLYRMEIRHPPVCVCVCMAEGVDMRHVQGGAITLKMKHRLVVCFSSLPRDINEC